MKYRKALLSMAAILLIAFSAAIIYALVKANFYVTGVFWDGAVTGAFGCLFLASFALAVLQLTGHGLATKRRSLAYLMLIVSGFTTTILFYFKPGDSDVWWYGAITGFLSSLSFVLAIVAVFLISNLKAQEIARNDN